ncbi:hypothetical protein NE237_018058 [Protea cynaroides]|uniref:Uncharacterized protein n=1 Tax=Protea cynaroides TaxID=273540 RepID=A0A9Q0QNT7_9MAGN|nr:hypothetical protein NE237_018058 [Protea cynaroides]
MDMLLFSLHKPYVKFLNGKLKAINWFVEFFYGKSIEGVHSTVAFADIYRVRKGLLVDFFVTERTSRIRSYF